MKNKCVLAAVLLVSGAGLLWSQFWKDFGEKERKSIGEAYWLVGKQYQTVGKTEKGSEYIDLGKLIFPQLDPAAIVDEKLPSAAELLAQGRATIIGAGAAEIPASAINSFFLRFIGALLEKDAEGVVGMMDGSVYITAVPVEMSRVDMKTQLDSFFKEAGLSGLTPSSLYDLDSLLVAKAPQSMQDAWGETYTLRIDARADFSKYMSFWEQKQQFFVRRIGANWFIFAIGQNPPPLTWAPQKAAVPETVTTAVPVIAKEADASKAITDAFTGFMSALLQKNADGALAFMKGEVRFLRLRQTVTRDELATTFMGYFDSASFGSWQIADVLDTDSIFVEPVKSPVEEVSGTVYLLNVRAKTDISASIPFWTTYQKYYFTLDAGNWKIFALL